MIIWTHGKPESRAAYPLFRRDAKPRLACLAATGAKRRLNPPDERKEGVPMYVTYSDLIQSGIFICALVGLCYTIFKGRRK